MSRQSLSRTLELKESLLATGEHDLELNETGREDDYKRRRAESVHNAAVRNWQQDQAALAAKEGKTGGISGFVANSSTVVQSYVNAIGDSQADTSSGTDHDEEDVPDAVMEARVLLSQNDEPDSALGIPMPVVEVTNDKHQRVMEPSGGEVKVDHQEMEEHEEDKRKENPVDESLMKTDPRSGLSLVEAQERLLTFGHNELVEKKSNPLLKFLSYFTGSIAYLIEAACILSGALQDWTDFGIILALLVVNACIGYFEEARAESAVEALRSRLALTTKVMRGGGMNEIPARELVPGDIISLRLGDIVPADCRLLGITANFEPTNQELSVDQAALTGESLPAMKKKGDVAYSGTTVKQGQQMAIVTHTGANTFLGRAAHLISISEDSGHFQKVIGNIGNFIIVITLVLVVIILIVALAKGEEFLPQLEYALVLTIASIPVGLPTVLSVTMAVGAKELAGKNVIVKRLTAIEEMAGLDILCSDKTGTLTLNELSVDEPYLADGATNADLLLAAFLASEAGAKDAIELCVRSEAVKVVPMLNGMNLDSSIIPHHRQLHFQPFDPVCKYTRATVLNSETGEVFCVAKGAPHVILNLCHHEDHNAHYAITSMASRGLRALGVARSLPLPDAGDANAPKNVEWKLVGLLSLLDPPRPDSGKTISDCGAYGLSVKMITGDAVLIAKEVAKRLGMHQNILHPSKLSVEIEEKKLIEFCERADGFAQVVPEDKYRVVELLQKNRHLVGMTGDGVNDAPALKKANVGIAVHGCTDAARSAADIVLLEPGLSTIVDGIVTSRCIFQRMRSYAVYRITSTVHFMIFMFFAILVLNWSLPTKLIILIALLNDAATIVISVDNAKVSQRPDKWRLGQIMSLSIILGIMLTGASFAHYFVANNVFNVSTDELNTIMYLQMSSCPHFVIFSTRVPGPFWEMLPSLVFFCAIVGTQIFAMFISVYGVIAAPIGWPWGIAVMGISVGCFFFLDAMKVFVYKRWSFELTAKLWPSKRRREKLQRLQMRVVQQVRFKRNLKKMKKAIILVRCAKAFAGARWKLRQWNPLAR